MFTFTHQMYGHGGERMVAGHAVDGFCLETNTVFQFHGCQLRAQAL